jgi:glucose/arabinose dehydrogenase
MRLGNVPARCTLALLAILGAATTGCPLPAAPPSESVGLEAVASGLTSPVYLTAEPNGQRVFVVDQVGLIWILDATQDNGLRSTPFLDLRDRLVELMSGFDERGLLSVALHPSFADNGRFFVFYEAPAGDDIPDGFNSESRISEFTVSPGDANAADPDSERILLRFGKPQFNHNGGQLAFGPDGMLYISTGDGGAGNDVGLGHTPDLGNGQDKTVLLGKILRIDVDAGDPYGIPADNPFASDATARPEIFAFGLRNPFRLSFDAGGARRLFVADVGQGLFEEVNIVVRGGNYGWNIREGLHCFDPNSPGSPPDTCAQQSADGEPLLDPIIEYPHFDEQGNPVGIAVVGGFVYRGNGVAGLRGDYVFGDFSRGFILPDGVLFAARENDDGTWTRRELGVAGAADGRLGRFVLGFGQDGDGELYLLSSTNVGPTGTTGRVDRIVAAP